MAGEKRSQERENAQHEENIVLVDIEGTTTSISFVKETLFPYVRANLKDYIEKKWDDAEFKEDIEKLKEQAKNDEADKIEGFIGIKSETPEESKESLMKNIIWQMDNDRKTGALKQLQGHIWRDAYKSGAIKGHLYEDVPKAFEAWTKNGRKIYVYSSGSVDAQKLLFGHSEHGDLLKYFDGYFDTEVGAKQDAASYKNIIAKIGCEPSNILFLTDIPNEGKAAIESGMASVIVVREGNTPLTPEEKTKFTVIQSFHDLVFQTATKRQKIEETSELEKKEVKKPEESRAAVVSEPMDTTENNETIKENEKKVEKETKVKTAVVDPKSESKPADDVQVTETKKDVSPMECETTVEAEKTSKESDDVSTKKEVAAPTASKASTSEIDAKTETDAKITETKVEEKVELKSESSTTLRTEEKKTDSVDKVKEASTKIESKTETVAEKKEANTDDKTKEPVKSEDNTPKVDGKTEEVKEKIANKSEEKVPEEKTSVVEESKQNGDSKSVTAAESTSKTNVATVAGVNGGVKNENTSPPVEVKETDKTTVDSVKPEVVVNAEPAKVETAKEDEKSTEEVVEKKLNGSAPPTTTTDKPDIATEKTHRNGVNEEKKQNGDDESMTDKESIKVKKVVDSIVDGAGEPDVVPPVAVVAATS